MWREAQLGGAAFAPGGVGYVLLGAQPSAETDTLTAAVAEARAESRTAAMNAAMASQVTTIFPTNMTQTDFVATMSGTMGLALFGSIVQNQLVGQAIGGNLAAALAFARNPANVNMDLSAVTDWSSFGSVAGTADTWTVTLLVPGASSVVSAEPADPADYYSVTPVDRWEVSQVWAAATTANAPVFEAPTAADFATVTHNVGGAFRWTAYDMPFDATTNPWIPGMVAPSTGAYNIEAADYWATYNWVQNAATPGTFQGNADVQTGAGRTIGGVAAVTVATPVQWTVVARAAGATETRNTAPANAADYYDVEHNVGAGAPILTVYSVLTAAGFPASLIGTGATGGTLRAAFNADITANPVEDIWQELADEMMAEWGDDLESVGYPGTNWNNNANLRDPLRDAFRAGFQTQMDALAGTIIVGGSPVAVPVANNNAQGTRVTAITGTPGGFWVTQEIYNWAFLQGVNAAWQRHLVTDHVVGHPPIGQGGWVTPQVAMGLQPIADPEMLEIFEGTTGTADARLLYMGQFAYTGANPRLAYTITVNYMEPSRATITFLVPPGGVPAGSIIDIPVVGIRTLPTGVNGVAGTAAAPTLFGHPVPTANSTAAVEVGGVNFPFGFGGAGGNLAHAHSIAYGYQARAGGMLQDDRMRIHVAIVDTGDEVVYDDSIVAHAQHHIAAGRDRGEEYNRFRPVLTGPAATVFNRPGSVARSVAQPNYRLDSTTIFEAGRIMIQENGIGQFSNRATFVLVAPAGFEFAMSSYSPVSSNAHTSTVPFANMGATATPPPNNPIIQGNVVHWNMHNWNPRVAQATPVPGAPNPPFGTVPVNSFFTPIGRITPMNMPGAVVDFVSFGVLGQSTENLIATHDRVPNAPGGNAGLTAAADRLLRRNLTVGHAYRAFGLGNLATTQSVLGTLHAPGDEGADLTRHGATLPTGEIDHLNLGGFPAVRLVDRTRVMIAMDGLGLPHGNNDQASTRNAIGTIIIDGLTLVPIPAALALADWNPTGPQEMNVVGAGSAGATSLANRELNSTRGVENGVVIAFNLVERGAALTGIDIRLDTAVQTIRPGLVNQGGVGAGLIIDELNHGAWNIGLRSNFEIIARDLDGYVVEDMVKLTSVYVDDYAGNRGGFSDPAWNTRTSTMGNTTLRNRGQAGTTPAPVTGTHLPGNRYFNTVGAANDAAAGRATWGFSADGATFWTANNLRHGETVAPDGLVRHHVRFNVSTDPNFEGSIYVRVSGDAFTTIADYHEVHLYNVEPLVRFDADYIVNRTGIGMQTTVVSDVTITETANNGLATLNQIFSLHLLEFNTRAVRDIQFNPVVLRDIVPSGGIRSVTIHRQTGSQIDFRMGVRGVGAGTLTIENLSVRIDRAVPYGMFDLALTSPTLQNNFAARVGDIIPGQTEGLPTDGVVPFDNVRVGVYNQFFRRSQGSLGDLTRWDAAAASAATASERMIDAFNVMGVIAPGWLQITAPPIVVDRTGTPVSFLNVDGTEYAFVDGTQVRLENVAGVSTPIRRFEGIRNIREIAGGAPNIPNQDVNFGYGTNFVPLRAVSEFFGAEIAANPFVTVWFEQRAMQAVRITIGDVVADFIQGMPVVLVGNTQLVVVGADGLTPLPILNIDGSVYLPARALMQAFNIDGGFNAASNMVWFNPPTGVTVE
jgi:hypothetical protein